MTVISIDIISDFVCAVSPMAPYKHTASYPNCKQWCYVSKRNLEAAVALYKKTYPNARTADSFTLIYRPYFLNHPGSPISFTTSLPKSQVAEQKLGHLSQDRRDALRDRMDKVGRAVGIQFRYGGNIGPTQDAHRLVYVSRRKGGDVQSRLVEGLLAAYHEQERDIADRLALRSIALEVGMSGEEVSEAFFSEEVARAVDEEQDRYCGVARGKGVPVYVIQGEHRIEGAQDASEFLDVFIKVKEADVAA